MPKIQRIITAERNVFMAGVSHVSPALEKVFPVAVSDRPNHPGRRFSPLPGSREMRRHQWPPTSNR